MHLFVQLDLDTTPRESVLPPHGLLQLFYCTSSDPLCEVELESFAPFGRAVVARLVPSDGAGALGSPTGIEPFPAREIAGWEANQDAPNWEESDCELSEEEEEALDAAEVPLTGDKWLGWPAWVQGVEYPDCRVCGEQMIYLLQIDSECNVPWMFGDVGTGHLSVCAKHLDELSFHWACC